MNNEITDGEMVNINTFSEGLDKGAIFRPFFVWKFLDSAN